HVNLIHNAAKYSPPGSPIFVTMRAESGFAMVTVRDEGSGIQDKVIVESLVDAGFEMSTLTAFIWAPVVFVAWADGNLDALEKAAILDALPNKGLSREMASMMIEHAWFTNRPTEELWRVWEEFANATLSSVPSHEREAGMDEIVDDSSAERLWP
ncbi:MAG: ATP-binding protein, partial [bacterium]